MTHGRMWVETKPMVYVFGIHDRPKRLVTRIAAKVEYEDDVCRWYVSTGPCGRLVFTTKSMSEALAIGERRACPL